MMFHILLYKQAQNKQQRKGGIFGTVGHNWTVLQYKGKSKVKYLGWKVYKSKPGEENMLVFCEPCVKVIRAKTKSAER